MEQPLTNLKDQTGRTNMSVSGFEASFDLQPEYGGRVYRFQWENFAEQRDGKWVIDFQGAKGIKLTKDSALTVVIPPGASLLTADPAPAASREASWSGTDRGRYPGPTSSSAEPFLGSHLSATPRGAIQALARPRPVAS